MNHRYLLIFFILGSICKLGFSQKTVKTTSGKEIVLMPDGSWNYKEIDFSNAKVINDPVGTNSKMEPDSLNGNSTTDANIHTGNSAYRTANIESEIQFNQDNIYLNPPLPDCEVIFDGFDEQSSKKRKELAPRFLFAYTHPKLKSALKDQDFLTCHAALIRMGGYTYISLDISIASKRAKVTYGQINQGSQISIKLINGDNLILQNLNQSAGQIEPITGHTKYRSIYPLGKSEIKMLKKTELDKIGIMWTTGFEEYEIYEIDFLMNQLDCLEQD